MTITTILLTLAVAFGVVSWIYSGVFLTLVLENARFWKVHQKSSTPSAHTYARSCIIIPCKGVERGLRENLTSFLRQDHPNYEVFFVIERESDPAATLIYNLMEENRCVKTRLIIAGRAENCGQKVHNLRMATKQLSNEIDVLVFADSDANPNKTWLRWLVNGIGKKGLGARTGYRWMIPNKNNFPTLVVCSINNAIATMLGRGKHHLVWGGSWAIHRKIFDAVGIREAWFGGLSDDLVASRALHKAGLNVEFEPQCVCTTRVGFSTSDMVEFLRRQLLIGRQYSPKYWYGAFALVAGSQIGFWSALVVGVWGVSQNMWIGYVAMTSFVLLYVMGVARSAVRNNIGRHMFPQWKQCKKARKFDMFAGPIVALVTFGSMIASWFGSEIIWRGIRYFIGRGGRVLVIGREMPNDRWPIDTTESELPSQGSVAQSKAAVVNVDAPSHSAHVATTGVVAAESNSGSQPRKSAAGPVASPQPSLKTPARPTGIPWDVHAGAQPTSGAELAGYDAAPNVLPFPGTSNANSDVA